MADKKQTKVYLIPEGETRDSHTYHYTVIKTRKFILENTKLKKGAKVVLHKVPKPELFGVAKINKRNKIISIKDTTPMPHNGTRPPKKRRV